MWHTYGGDFSGYQSARLPRLDFAYIKATEGTGYVNPRLSDQVASGRAQDESLGFYHFSHPGNVAQQVDHFLHTVLPHLKPGDVLWLDWEPVRAANGSWVHMTSAEKDQFLYLLAERLREHRSGLYCDVDFWRNVDRSGHRGDALWLANYNHRPGVTGIKTPVEVHQYTDGPGFDHNVGRWDSREEMRAWALAKVTSHPAPVPPHPAPTGSSTAPATGSSTPPAHKPVAGKRQHTYPDPAVIELEHELSNGYVRRGFVAWLKARKINL